MTTYNLILHVEDEHSDIINTFKTLASRLKGVSSYELKKSEEDFIPKSEEEVKIEFKQVLKDIKSGKAFEEADDFDNIFTQK